MKKILRQVGIPAEYAATLREPARAPIIREKDVAGNVFREKSLTCGFGFSAKKPGD